MAESGANLSTTTTLIADEAKTSTTPPLPTCSPLMETEEEEDGENGVDSKVSMENFALIRVLGKGGQSLLSFGFCGKIV